MHSRCSKVCYYQPKTQHFLGYNKSTTPQFCAIFFFKINPDAHVSTKNEYNHILQGGPGAIAPESQGNVKKDAFLFHVMMSIQIRARGGPGVTPRLFFVKMVQVGAI